MRVVAISQARSGSTRLPGKILKSVQDKTLLEIHIQRILKSSRIDQLVVATTLAPEDQKIIDIATKLKVNSFAGSENDVLDRFYQALQASPADYIVRLTSDCPLIDPQLIDNVVEFAVTNNLDYCSNTLAPTFPDGQDIEVFKYKALETAWQDASLPSEREHVTPFIWKNSTFKGGTLFTSDNFSNTISFETLRMTVDEPADFDLIKILIEQLGTDASWLQYAEFLSRHKEVSAINGAINRNEGYSKSINKE